MALRTALVTGALGQDGSLLTELLLSHGYRVVGIVREGALVPRTGPLAEVTFVSVDLTDSKAVRTLLDAYRPTEIYHLAAVHHSSQQLAVSSADGVRDAMLATNFLSTKVLAFAILEMRLECHLIFASSSQIFTASSNCEFVDELSPRRPSTFYGHTKSWAMDMLAFLRRDSGLRASSAILFNHESPRRNEHFVSRKIARAAAQAASGMQPSLHLQNIGARADWSSAKDVVGALYLMGRAQAAGDFIVASGTLHSVRDMLQVTFEQVGLDWTQFTTFREDQAVPAIVGLSSRLERAMGWSRSRTFREVMTEMVSHDLWLLNGAHSDRGAM